MNPTANGPIQLTVDPVAWIFRLAVGEAKKGESSGRISVIDASEINSLSLLHAQPFHRELCKRLIFDNAAWFYSGKRE